MKVVKNHDLFTRYDFPFKVEGYAKSGLFVSLPFMTEIEADCWIYDYEQGNIFNGLRRDLK